MSNESKMLKSQDIIELLMSLKRGNECEIGFYVDGNYHNFIASNGIMIIDMSSNFYKHFPTKIILAIYENTIYLNEEFIYFKKYIEKIIPKHEIKILSNESLNDEIGRMKL